MSPLYHSNFAVGLALAFGLVLVYILPVICYVDFIVELRDKYLLKQVNDKLDKAGIKSKFNTDF